MTKLLNNPPTLHLAIDNLERTSNWITAKAEGLAFAADDQQKFGYGCLFLAYEHQRGMLSLVKEGEYASLLALMRVQLEAFLRGTWLVRAASTKQFQIFLETKQTEPRSLRDLARVVAPLVGDERGVLVRFCDQSIQALHGFTHSDIHAVSRRYNGTELGALYDEEDILRAVHLATVVGLLAFKTMAECAGTARARQ